MNEALEWIERHAIEYRLTPAQVRDRFLAGEMAARVLVPTARNGGADPSKSTLDPPRSRFFPT